MGMLFTTQKNVTTAGTAVTISAAPDWHTGVKIKAKMGNTGAVYIGPSGGTSATTGYQLEPGEEYPFPADADVDLNQIGLDAAVSGEGVTVIAAS